ncbi:MAG: beta strand repeat-containing protein [Gemmatimonadaceae bacterium]
MKARSRVTAVGISAAFVLLAATSCDAPSVAEADRVERIVLTPSGASMQAGATVTLSALVLNAAGDVIRDRKVVWASENQAIATVSQSGVVLGVAPGVVQIAASSGGKSASATITVTRRPVSLVRVTPGTATISVSSSITLQAEAIDATGAPVLGSTVRWQSSDETIAIVSTHGVVVGLAPGSVTISATIDGRVGTAAIAVAPQPVSAVMITPLADTLVVGSRVRFRASPVDSQNVALAGRIVLWSSSDPLVATVSSDGEVIGLAVGSARIRATVEGKFAEATVLVQQVPVANVAVTPNEVTLTPGQTSQVTVTLSDSAGNVLIGRSVTFATSDATIASVSTAGLIIAVAQGSTRIEVSSEGKSATVAVTVNPTPIASIAISPNAATLRVPQTTRLVAQAFDARGAPLSNRSFTWSSTAANVASVNQSGDVTAVGTGSSSISAASEGQAATAVVTVVAAPAAVIVIAPKPVSLLPAQTQQLSVQLFDSAGGLLSQAGRPIAWGSRDPAVTTVSSSGLVTAVAPGNTRVIVSTAGASASVVDSVNVTVTQPAASSIAVQPKAHVMNVGGTHALRAVVVSSGAAVRGRNVAWQSRSPSVVSVSPVAGWPDSATVVGVSLGAAYVVASESGLSDSALVTVTSVPVMSVVVTPATANVTVNGTAQLNAVAKDSIGGTLARTITWVSRSPSTASVSTTGVVTGVASGAATIEARANGAGVNGADVVGTATVTVPARPVAAVASVVVTPATTSMSVSATTQLTAVAKDSAGNTLTPTITWVSRAPNIATISATGLVTANASGSATIEARANGAGVNGTDVVGLAAVTVTAPAQVPAPVRSVTVTSPRSTIVPGDTMHLTVVLRDAQNNVLTGRPITFASSSSKLTVDISGIVAGVGTSGGTDIIATSEGRSGKVQLHSTEGVAKMRVVGPANNVLDLVIPVGGKKRYTVTVDDDRGRGINNLTIVVSTNNGSVLSLSKTSIVTNGKGEADVDVSANGTVGVATITFTAVRTGAIPPAKPGSNTQTASLPIVVP